MVIVETYSVAVALSVITMICWGSWPNTQKAVSATWRFELFYWDYVIGIVASALVFAVTMGSLGSSGRGFFEDLRQADTGHVASAMLGGVIFNAANILFVAAISLTGMAIAFPVGAGVGLVLGVSLNFIANPIGNPYYLFGGVVLVVAAILLSATAHHQAVSDAKRVSGLGIVFTIAAGVLFGFFYRFIAESMSTDFRVPEPGKLGPYSAVICFSLGVFASNLLFNTLLMKRPVQGRPLALSAYFRGSWRDHGLGVLGGAIWGTGLLFSMLSAGKAGYAISFGLGQGNALVAALWGVFVWKEFAGAPRMVRVILCWMFMCYIFGLLAIIYARY